LPELLTNASFSIERRVAFRDTNALGVAHHTSFVLFCEQARVGWMRARGLSHIHYPKTDHVLALLNYKLQYFGEARLDDIVRIALQVRRQGLKIQFQYAIYKDEQRIVQAETLHFPVDAGLRPVRPHSELLTHLEKEPWIETWLSNL
jgi:acyl-CoA thioester hydrolase